MNHKQIGYIVIAVLIGAAGGFFGGIKYEQTKAQNTRGMFVQRTGGSGGNFFFSGNGGGGNRGMRAFGGGFVAGQVLSKDDKSITIKSMDGGSKIVFYATSTPISKPSPVSIGDLNVGDNVIVTGSAGSDGSITAQNIQIRPEMSQTNSTKQ